MIKSEVLQVVLSGKTIEFEVKRRKNQKNIVLRVLPDKTVLVTASKYTLQRSIKSFVLKKINWILKILDNMQEVKPLQDGSTLLYLGNKCLVDMKFKEFGKTKIKLQNSIFTITTPKNTSREKLQQELDAFYKEEARRIFLTMVKQWSDKMFLFPSKVGFRKTKTIWGSCNCKSAISLNTELVKIEPKLAEYVVVHELAHIKHLNHSRQFWALVSSYLPDFKERKKELRKISISLRDHCGH